MTESSRIRLRPWRIPIALTALVFLLQIVESKSALEYRRTAILNGELWRLLTGSLVHLGWVHLFRDIAGLFLIWGLRGHELNERMWLCVLLTSALAVGLGLLIFSPHVTWYVGLSGALFGAFCAGTVAQLREHPRYASGMLLAMTGLIAWTWYAGALPEETAGLGGRVVPQAHLYGALGGAAVMLGRSWRTPWRSRAVSQNGDLTAGRISP